MLDHAKWTPRITKIYKKQKNVKFSRKLVRGGSESDLPLVIQYVYNTANLSLVVQYGKQTSPYDRY